MSTLHAASVPFTPTDPRPEIEGFAVPTPVDDDGIIRERDPDLDAWLDDCARNDAAAAERVSWRDELELFVAAYRRHFGVTPGDDDPTPPGAPAALAA